MGFEQIGRSSMKEWTDWPIRSSLGPQRSVYSSSLLGMLGDEDEAAEESLEAAAELPPKLGAPPDWPPEC